MRRTLKLVCTALIGAVTFVPMAAGAQFYGAPQGYYGQRYAGGYGRGYGQDRSYHGDRRYYGDRRAAYDRRGDDRRYYRGGGRCRDKGTGGTILGAIAGGLLGDSVAGRGDRTAGALVGAGVGALAGRAIDRDC